jgi:hypothetical protein
LHLKNPFFENGKVDFIFKGELPRATAKRLVAHYGAIAGQYLSGIGNSRHTGAHYFFDGRIVQRGVQEYLWRVELNHRSLFDDFMIHPQSSASATPPSGFITFQTAT